MTIPDFLRAIQSSEVKGVLTTLDCTEEVVDEAIGLNANLIVAHHPILFKGIKKLTGSNYVERVIIKAIKNDIAIYAIHTNLDNVHTGVNKKLAERIGLTNLKILAPKSGTLEQTRHLYPKRKCRSSAYLLCMRQALARSATIRIAASEWKGQARLCQTNLQNPTSENPYRRNTSNEIRAELIFPSHLTARYYAGLKEVSSV